MSKKQLSWLVISLVVVSLFSVVCNAGLADAAKIRGANKLIKKGKLVEANLIYKTLPNNEKMSFNKGYLHALSKDMDQSKLYYQVVLQSAKSSKSERVKAYFNLGNNSLKQGEFKLAIDYYRKGLLLDPHNYKLKYNLELANNAKKLDPEKQEEQQQKKQNQEQDQEKQNAVAKKQGQKSQEEKSAEKVLDAFKQNEQEDIQNDLQKERERNNVEKDW